MTRITKQFYPQYKKYLNGRLTLITPNHPNRIMEL